MSPASRGRLVAVAVVAALGVAAGSLALGRALGGPDGPETVSSDALAPVPGDDPGLQHVHGLGVHPDGTLYAATHGGVFRVPEDGPPERVAHRYQDTMGFTVTADGEFLASGHPDLREGLPPLLGLISSTDRAQTWRSESLLGDVDFHALRVSGDVVYGWDATRGRLLVSRDRREWEDRAGPPLRDLAVDPQDAEHLLATTPAGLQRSRDGGRTWSGVPDAPPLVVLAWSDAGLLGVAVDGTVHAAVGETWERRGTAGDAPEAVAVRGDEVHVATAGGRLVSSEDGGRTFRTRHDASADHR